jgi:O-6-methylguanine DNA methyltransferase
MNTPSSKKIFYYSIAETAIGWIGIAGNEKGLRRLVLPVPTRENALAELNRYFQPCEKLAQVDSQFISIVTKIKNYFDGKKIQFETEIINLEGYTSFQKNILLKTREIPYGITQTYGWLAEQSGYPKAYRAVGGVMRFNPLPLIIPCHRVLGSQGKLTGFSATGGLALKRKMLELEGVLTSK